MKTILSLLVLLAFTSSLNAQQITKSSPQVVNSIAIVINDEVITTQELQERIRMIEQRLKAQGVALPPPAELRKQIIERLIVDRAQLQLARDMGMRVDDAMLDRAMLRIAEQNKMTLPTFRDQVEKEGMSYAQFREGVREEILLQRIKEREVDSKVEVSESEVTSYLSAQKSDPNSKLDGAHAGGIPQAHIRHILIKITPTVTKEQATHKLLGFKQRLENGGAKFEDLAKQFSNDSSASKGGDLGWLYPGDVPEFDSVITQMTDGQISGPVETPQGMHLIQLLGHKTDEVSTERQRLLARQAIRARKTDEATGEWMRELRDRAYVEIRNTDPQ